MSKFWMQTDIRPSAGLRRVAIKSMIAFGTSLTALCAGPVQAQVGNAQERSVSLTSGPSQPPAQDAIDTSDIVVTAQKREQRLLDVPVPVTAVASDTLVKENLTTIRDYFARIPGLQYSGDRVQNLAIRGITTGGATNPTLAILVDDVPFGSATQNGSSNIPDFDPSVLQQIEVLRGPQGTLYGASSLGGLIKYVTRQPSLTTFGGQVQFGANNIAHGGYGITARGSVDIPVVKDHIGLEVNAFYRRDPAYQDNIDRSTGFRQVDANLSREWGGRAALVIKPVDVLTISLSAIRQEARSSGSNAVDFVSTTNFSGVPENYAVVRTLGQPSFSKFNLYSAKVGLDLGSVRVTSVSGWNTAITTPLQDLTSIFGGLLKRFYPNTKSVFLINAHNTSRFSEELRLDGKIGIVDWLVGGFYSIEHANIAQTMSLRDASGAEFAVPYDGAGPSAYREYAGFGDLTFHLTSRFDLQLGARYAHNKMVNDQNVVIAAAAAPIFGPSTSTEAQRSDNAFTWLVTPSYHVTPDIMLYARVANGYRPGGTNALVAGVPLVYNSDRVINYEIGAKGTALDRVIEFDLSMFQIDWRDIQLQNTSPNNFTFTTNGGRARSRGVELQGSIKPWKNGVMSLNGALTDAVLTQTLYVVPGGIGLLGGPGDRLPFTAKFTGNVGFEQDFELTGDLRLNLGANVSYLGSRYSEFPVSSGGTGIRMKMPSYTQVDLRSGLQIRQGWSLDIFVRNLFDARGVVYASDRGGTVAPTGNYIRPRTVGFTVTGKF